MTKAVVPQTQSPGIDLEKVLIKGDLAALSPPQRVQYYTQVCESLGLNPLTKPFDYIVLNGKLTLYAKKDAAEQLRSINNVSITNLQVSNADGVCEVTATASLPNGRTDVDMGIVTTANLKGDNLANARLKAVTKAKRRVTLSICGLGFLDETEIETIHDARSVVVTPEGAIVATNPTPTNGDHKGKVIGKEDKPATPQPTNGRPYPPHILKAKIANAVQDYTEKGWTPGDSDRTMIVPNMEMCFAGDPNSEANRKAVTKYLVGKTSTKDLTDAEVIAFKKWLNAKPDDGGEWHPDPNTVQEAVQINILTLKTEGQQELPDAG